MLGFLEVAFVVIAIWFAVTLLIRKFFMKYIENSVSTTEFTGFMGLLLILYTIAGLLIMFFIPKWGNKFWVFMFSASPYIIGKFAKYETEKYFSYIQLLIIVASIIFISFKY